MTGWGKKLSNLLLPYWYYHSKSGRCNIIAVYCLSLEHKTMN